MLGEVLYKTNNTNIRDRLPNGTGILYYDLPYHKIRYVGEFENGMYDGTGIFYTMDGKISIRTNNISNGITHTKSKTND